MPERYRPHLFDRGWTPAEARREERTSSGLGLFIAKALANRYCGDLAIQDDSSILLTLR